MQSLPFIGNMEANNDDMASLPLQSQGYHTRYHDDDNDVDMDAIDNNVELGYPRFAFDQEQNDDAAPMLRNRFVVSTRNDNKRTTTSSKPLAPKLRIRPHRDAFSRNEEILIILPGEEDGSDEKFGDLLFPSPNSNKFLLQIPDASMTQELRTLNTPVEDEDGGDNDTYYEEAHEKIYSEGTTSQGGGERHTTVLPRTTDCKVGISSASMSIGSSFLRPTESNASFPSHHQIKSVTSPGNSSLSSSPFPIERAHCQKKMVLLKPKKGRSLSHIEINGVESPGPTSVCSPERLDNGLEPTFDTMANDLTLIGNNNRSANDAHSFASRSHRGPSVSFSDDCDFFTRSRTASSNSIQEQIEMAKEAAARFGGSSKFMVASNLSESSFRTPNAESASNNQGVSSSDKKGIYMPMLF
jgi:hypothetical protein